MRAALATVWVVACLAAGAYHACWSSAACLAAASGGCTLAGGACGAMDLAPTVREATLFWGDSLTTKVRVVNNRSLARPIDAVFAIDYTGSMRDDLDVFRSTWPSITDVLNTRSSGDFRVSIIPFANQITRWFGSTRGLTPFNDFGTDYASANAAVQSALSAIYEQVTGGEECRENSYEAIQYAVSENWKQDWGYLPKARWRDRALRLVFVITDAGVFTNRYDDMRRLADEAKKARIVVFGLTPDPEDPKYRSPCPPTCPRCAAAGKPCVLSCSKVKGKSGVDEDVCESTCCSGNPEWLGVYTTKKCIPPAGGQELCSDEVFGPGSGFERYQYCYDLVNITRDSGGSYFQSFNATQLSDKLSAAFEEVDHNLFTLGVRKLAGPGELDIALAQPSSFEVEICDWIEEADARQDPPCRQSAELRVAVPKGTSEGDYLYNVTVDADTGLREELQLSLHVRAPLRANLTYAAAAAGERVLVLLNLTNAGDQKDLAPEPARSTVSCAGREALVHWDAGSGRVAPGASLLALADCTGAARRSRGMRLAVTSRSPAALAGTLSERVEVTVNVTNATTGHPVPFLDDPRRFTLTLNGVPLSAKDVMYLEGTKLYRVSGSTPAGAARDGYNALEVGVEDSGSSASELALVRRGAPSLEVSSLLQLGPTANEVLSGADTARVLSLASPLALKPSSLFVHTDYALGGLRRKAGPELVVNHTVKRGFVLLRSVRRSDGAVEVLYNRSGAVPTTIVRSLGRSDLLGRDLELVGLSNGTLGAAVLDPAYDVLFGALALPDSSVRRVAEGMSGPLHRVVVEYENYTIWRPALLPFTLSSPEPLPSVRLLVSAPSVERALTMSPGAPAVREAALFANASRPRAGGVGLEVRVAAAGSGTVVVNASSGHRDEVVLVVPFVERDPFVIGVAPSITAVPNLTTALLLTLTSRLPTDDSLRVCATGDGVRVMAGALELTAAPRPTAPPWGQPAPTAPPCHQLPVKAGERATVNLTVTLMRETAGSLTLNVSSVSDPLMRRTAAVAVAPGNFSRSSISIEGCRKDGWRLTCTLTATNGGNAPMRYLYGVMPDLMAGNLTQGEFELAPKQGRTLDVSALLVACDVGLDDRELLLSLGRLHFLGRAFAAGPGYALAGGLGPLAPSLSEVQARLELLRPTEALRARFTLAVERFRAAPGSATGEELAAAAEAIYDGYMASLRAGCTMTHSTQVRAAVMACDTPVSAGGNATFACGSDTPTVTGITFPFDCDVEAAPELRPRLDAGGALGVLVGERTAVPIVVRNRMHFDLLFDFTASASYTDEPLLESSRVPIPSMGERAFVVNVTPDAEGDHRLYLKSTPSGMPENRQSLDVTLRAGANVRQELALVPHVASVDLEAGEEGRLVVEVRNLGNRRESFSASLEGELGKSASLSEGALELAAGEAANLTATVRSERRATLKGRLVVRLAGGDLSRDAALSAKVSAAELSASGPQSISASGAVVVRNAGDLSGEVRLSLRGDSAGCVRLLNDTAVVGRGGSVSVGLENECEGAGSVQVLVDGPGLSAVLDLQVAARASPTPEPTSEPSPTPEPASYGRVAAVGGLLAVAAVVGLALVRKRAGAAAVRAALAPGLRQGAAGGASGAAAYGRGSYGYTSNYMNRYPYYGRR